jgi:hypothetical protein
MFRSQSMVRISLAMGILMFALTIAGSLYCNRAIDQIADGFKQDRKTQAAWFAKLVKDNWKGIGTLSDPQKKQLMENLDPRLAGTDIELMRFQALFLSYALFATWASLILVSTLRSWRKLRNGPSAAASSGP